MVKIHVLKLEPSILCSEMGFRRRFWLTQLTFDFLTSLHTIGGMEMDRNNSLLSPLEARKKRMDFFFSSRAPNVTNGFCYLSLKSDRKRQINILIKNPVFWASRTSVTRNPYISGPDVIRDITVVYHVSPNMSWMKDYLFKTALKHLTADYTCRISIVISCIWNNCLFLLLLIKYFKNLMWLVLLSFLVR